MKITANDGVIIWDAHHHDNDRCSEIIKSMQTNVQNLYPGTTGQYIEKEYDLMSKGERIAVLRIGSYEPYYLTEQDVVLINALNKAFIIASALSMLLALGVAWLLASSLSKPVTAATLAADKIARGDLGKLMDEKSPIAEMASLASAVNRLSDSLVAQEQLRTRLIRDVAHELRTPIATLQAQIEAMQDGIWELDAKRLASLLEEILRLSRLTENLTNLTRYEDDSLSLTLKKTDLADLTAEVAERYRGHFRTRSLELVLKLDQVSVFIDRDKICQVIVNLLDNALKYTTAGSITVSTGRAGQTAVLTVTDTGTGISPQHIDHIFDRFYRTDEARRRDTGGTGIGLSIVSSIVSAHGGHVSVASEPGKGSTFTVQLPVSE
jgi:signal transduction histidine kinase